MSALLLRPVATAHFMGGTEKLSGNGVLIGIVSDYRNLRVLLIGN